MVMAFKYGLMVLDMKVIGGTTRLAEKANFGMLMEMSLKENGRMIRQMVMEFIST